MPSGTRTKVVHGCRQLVPSGVGLSPVTSATLVFSCHIWNPEQTAGDKLEEDEDEVKSSCPRIHALGDTHATMDGTKGRCDPARVS